MIKYLDFYFHTVIPHKIPQIRLPLSYCWTGNHVLHWMRSNLIYMPKFTDVSTSKEYLGSAYSSMTCASRWQGYVKNYGQNSKVMPWLSTEVPELPSWLRQGDSSCSIHLGQYFSFILIWWFFSELSVEPEQEQEPLVPKPQECHYLSRNWHTCQPSCMCLVSC